MIINSANGSGDSIQGFVKRSDGSIRQVIVQRINQLTGEPVVLARGYFKPGTMESENLGNEVMYHWIDAYTDEELLDPANELIFDKDYINKLRNEAKQANLNKEFVHVELQKYKR